MSTLNLKAGTNIELYQDGEDLEIKYKDTYSTNEIDTGKVWIDGKPIYRKVINFTSSSEDISSWTTIETVPNLETSINIYSNYKGSDRNINFPRYESDSFHQIYRIFNHNIQYISKGYKNMNINIVIEYTKTTD